MGSEIIDKIYCKRIYDYTLAMATMNEMWSDISEDGAECYTPDLLNEWWIGLYFGDTYIGMYRIHQLTSACYQGHVFMLPKHRRHSVDAGHAIMGWSVDNLPGLEKMIVEVPECFENVIRFVESLGFTEQGYNSHSYKKNGLIGTYQYGITKNDMVRLWRQQRR